MGEGVVDEAVGMRLQGVVHGGVALDAVLGEEAAELDVEALAHRGEIGLAVELNRVDAIAVGPAVAGRQLVAE